MSNKLIDDVVDVRDLVIDMVEAYDIDVFSKKELLEHGAYHVRFLMSVLPQMHDIQLRRTVSHTIFRYQCAIKRDELQGMMTAAN